MWKRYKSSHLTTSSHFRFSQSKLVFFQNTKLLNLNMTWKQPWLLSCFIKKVWRVGKCLYQSNHNQPQEVNSPIQKLYAKLSLFHYNFYMNYTDIFVLSYISFEQCPTNLRGIYCQWGNSSHSSVGCLSVKYYCTFFPSGRVYFSLWNLPYICL